MQVAERKLVNICMSNNNSNVGLNIPFKPDCMIVRSYSYSGDTVLQNKNYQLSSDIHGDQVLFTFPGCLSTTYLCNGTLDLQFDFPNFSQNKIYNFQIQEISTTGTGPGVQSTTANGKLAFMLEFIKYKASK